MRVAHLLRKYDPSEWGGTETGVKRLLDGLLYHNVHPIIFCPRTKVPPAHDPLVESGYEVKRFKACVPVWGISGEQKKLLISVGGNILSFDLIWLLLREKNIALIHSHTGNRLGGIALTVAKIRRLPLVLTIHGGVLDLPQSARDYLSKPLQGGFEWGKFFGAPLRSRRVIEEADAIITNNKKEADLLGKKYPSKRIMVQPHSVPAEVYQKDHREKARAAFPQISGRQILLIMGRIDPVKNQSWVIEQVPAIFQKFPNALLVLAGSCTDAAYGEKIKKLIAEKGLAERVLLTGGLPPEDSKLIGLLQEAQIVLLPSLSETFGLVILEAWAAGNTVISSRTSGAQEMIREGENGWLFDLENPAQFHAALETVLSKPDLRLQYAANGAAAVLKYYDTNVLGGRVKKLYEELIETKNEIRHSAR